MSELARIYSSNKKVFLCRLEASGEKVNAVPTGKLYQAESFVVGDLVKIAPTPGGGHWQMLELMPRKNIIYRYIQREKQQKLIASHVDSLLIVTTTHSPPFKRGLIDRYLIRASQWNIPAYVVFQKMDLYQPPKLLSSKSQGQDTKFQDDDSEDRFDLDFELNRFANLKVLTYEVSTLKKNFKPYKALSVKDLKEKLKGTTTLLMGQSGVGKSSLITFLSGGKVWLPSQELGKVGKGMHTTTWAELIECGEFVCVDSPGIRSLSLSDLSREEILSHMPDLASIARYCKFSNCEHHENVKGCAFWNDSFQARSQEANSTLEIMRTRLESFQKIITDSEVMEDWERKKIVSHHK
jgi:ribosome biogenesis GTPase